MALAHPPAIQSRRTVLTLALAAASMWIFVLGVTIPGTLGSAATVQAATPCTASAGCLATAAAAPSPLAPAGAPQTVRVSVPTP